MSRTFRKTPFSTAYSQATRNRVVLAILDSSNSNGKALEQDRRVNGYDCRGLSSLGMPGRGPKGFNTWIEEWRPRLKRHVKRETARIVRRRGNAQVRGELSAMAEV